ncbi:MAG: winged helix-turn-helix domain-containing protein [Bacteroidales bacterium]|nr:winged helix-turn-helix domain-containing protein [Bacteroidales bacterium]
MNKFKNAAIEILKEAGEPLHYKEITKRALEKGILESEGKTPDASMNAQITTEIASLGEASTFIRIAPAIFGINPKPIDQPKHKLMKSSTVKGDDSGGSNYVAKSGEFYVCSELLLRGFNASIMSVDVGMDLIATKNNKLFSLQVKTANEINNQFVFNVRKVALEREYAGNVYYVFVMIHEDISKSVLILPAHKIDELIFSNIIKEVKNHERFSVTLKVRKDEIFIGTLSNPIVYYWNNWEVIK